MPSGASTGRTFRLFVSSTFKDLSAERNALQKYVFPMLVELCARNQARFQPIDLRWGVSAEAGLDQRAVEICLTEIERCQRLKLKPNFIVLLGDRYGWQPLPSRIEAAKIKAIAGKVSVADKALLVWDDQQPMASKGWYSRDDNSVPPGYVLRPREETIKSEADDAARGATETRLRGILLAAIAQLGWRANDLPMAKYIASATSRRSSKVWNPGDRGTRIRLLPLDREPADGRSRNRPRRPRRRQAEPGGIKPPPRPQAEPHRQARRIARLRVRCELGGQGGEHRSAR